MTLCMPSWSLATTSWVTPLGYMILTGGREVREGETRGEKGEQGEWREEVSC